MGRDKALLPAVDGSDEPMWERQRAVLAAAGAAKIYLSVRPEQMWARGAGAAGAGPGRIAGLLHDALPGCGPLVGITAALERATEATHVAAIAVDLPRMPAEWFGRLRERCGPGVGAVGKRRSGGDGKAYPEGYYEPLAAVYPRDVRWLAWEALARGGYALQPWLRCAVADGLMREVEIGAEEAGWFENRNEPAVGSSAGGSGGR
jgi:molybdopterin-guanine dinucleotide biosynthesis protein A